MLFLQLLEFLLVCQSFTGNGHCIFRPDKIGYIGGAAIFCLPEHYKFGGPALTFKIFFTLPPAVPSHELDNWAKSSHTIHIDDSVEELLSFF